MGKVKKNLGMGKLFIAAIFLFNPNIVIIDFLPDFIGYIFLLLGISQLADLNYHFEESQSLFKRMFTVSLAQFFAIFIVFGVLPTREQSSALMLMSFAFGALELILLIPAFKAFFDGFIYLGSRHTSTAIFYIKPKRPPSPKAMARKEARAAKKEAKTRLREEQARKTLSPKALTKKQAKAKRIAAKKLLKAERAKKARKMNATTKATVLTLTFIILKPVLTFAPEILSMFDTTVNPNLNVNFYRYVDSFRLLSLFFLIPIGIVWLVGFVKYIRSIIKDKPFMNEISDKYTDEITPKTFMFIQRYIKLAFVVLAVALVFNIDFYIDNISILPDFISPIIFIIVLGIIRKFAKAPIISYVFAIGYIVTSAITFICNIYFYDNYTLTLTYINPEAYDVFMLLTVFKIVDSLMFAGMIISLLPLLSKIIMENTGFVPISTTNFNAEEKVEYVHSMLKKKLTIISVFTVIAAASSICYMLFLRQFLYMWIIEFVVYIAFAVYFIHTLNDIQEEIDYKYMLS